MQCGSERLSHSLRKFVLPRFGTPTFPGFLRRDPGHARARHRMRHRTAEDPRWDGTDTTARYQVSCAKALCLCVSLPNPPQHGIFVTALGSKPHIELVWHYSWFTKRHKYRSSACSYKYKYILCTSVTRKATLVSWMSRGMVRSIDALQQSWICV